MLKKIAGRSALLIIFLAVAGTMLLSSLALALSFSLSSLAAPRLIGGEKDSHGCLVAAGYSWCEAKLKCFRPWEEDCLASLNNSTPFIESLVPPAGPVNNEVMVNGRNLYAPPNTRIIFKKENIGEESLLPIIDDLSNTLSFKVPARISQYFICPPEVVEGGGVCSQPPPVAVTEGEYTVSVQNALGVSNEVIFTVTSSNQPKTEAEIIKLASDYFNRQYSAEGVEIKNFIPAEKVREIIAAKQQIYYGSDLLATLLIFNISGEYYSGQHIYITPTGAFGYSAGMSLPFAGNDQLTFDPGCLSSRNCELADLTNYSHKYLANSFNYKDKVTPAKLENSRDYTEYLPLRTVKFGQKESWPGIQEVEVYLDNSGQVLASRVTKMLLVE